MKRLLTLALAACLLTGSADTMVSDVVVSQRWPWNEKIDVDFTLTGGAADVEVTATWDGQDEPYELGTILEAKAGRNRVTWNPAASPFAGRMLTGFVVSVSLTSMDPNRYLVVDLDDGSVSYAYRPDGTDGRWSDAYKTRKMVFRRVPADSYALGMTADELTRWYGSDTKASSYVSEKTRRGSRTQTFSSDFYLAVFQLTAAQYEKIATGTDSASLMPKKLSYDELRGSTNAADGVCWPKTGHRVTADSFLGKFRARAQTSFTIDLPTEEQWEAAARAGSTTVFPNGGSASDSDTQLWTVFGRGDWYYGNGGTATKDVGLKDPDNGWGFHDMLGNQPEWTLDVWLVDGYGRPIKSAGTIDPAGAETWKVASPTASSSNAKKINEAYAMRVVRSANPIFDTSSLESVLPSARNGKLPQANDCTARLCIYLKPLVTP